MFFDEQRAATRARAFAGDGNSINSAAYHHYLVPIIQRRPLFQGKVHLFALDALPGNSIGRDGPNAAKLVSRRQQSGER